MQVNEREILEAALLGYQSKIGELQNKMRDIEERLNPEPTPEIVAWDANPVTITRHRLHLPKPRRTFSAATRAKMAAAQKKRWRLLKRAAA